MTQVPHVPCTHACPPSHWLFAVHAVHAPLTQTSPLGELPNTNCPDCVQSAFLVHDVHTPWRHVCPLAQSVPVWHLLHSLPLHPCPVAQAAAVLHMHAPPWQFPAAPHWLSLVH